jgi:CubicO group peptidase (beta-lactamase class C family)
MKRSISAYLFFLAGILILAGTGCKKESTPEVTTEITSVENGLVPAITVKGQPSTTYTLEQRMEDYNVPGVSIAVVKDGKLRWAKGYGLANTKTGQEVTTQTLFQAGSISKPLAALAVLKLWEEGRVDLDTDVNAYLKGWQVPDTSFTTSEKVTLRRLLTHTAGMTVHGFPGYAADEGFPGIIQVLKGEGNTPGITVDTIPGSIWRYSGGGYTVMQKVVEDVSGQPLGSYMWENILQPMGLNESTFQQPLGSKRSLYASAAFNAQGEMVEGLWHNYPEQAAAGLWTTPSDLSRYCMQIQEIYGGKEDGILKPGTIRAMLTKHKGDWGLGPALQKEGDSLLFGHGGKNEGFSNNMLAFAGKGDAMIVMTNADRGVDLMGEVMRAISATYGWGISNSRVVTLEPQPVDSLSRFTGKYQLDFQVPDIGDYTIEVTLGDGTLEVFDPNNGERNSLSPLGPRKFIDLESGDEVAVILQGDTPEILFNGRFRFEKVEE